MAACVVVIWGILSGGGKSPGQVFFRRELSGRELSGRELFAWGYCPEVLSGGELSGGEFTGHHTVDSAKKDPFCPVLALTGGVTLIFLHEIYNRKYVYTIEN